MKDALMVKAVVPFVLVLLGACASVANQPVADPACIEQANQGIPKYVEGGGMTAPRVIHRVEPIASLEVMRRRPRIATVEAIIGADGLVQSACHISGDPQWAKHLKDAVLQWRFEPATQDGKPVAVLFTLTSSIK